MPEFEIQAMINKAVAGERIRARREAFSREMRAFNRALSDAESALADYMPRAKRKSAKRAK